MVLVGVHAGHTQVSFEVVSGYWVMWRHVPIIEGPYKKRGQVMGWVLGKS